MKKCLFLIVFLLLSRLHPVQAQTLKASPDSLFFGPDTVCVNQPVSLLSNVFNASSYYWGFCSGFLMDPPTGTNLGSGFGFHMPANIDIVKDTSGHYFGFVVNASTRELLRLSFGTALTNTPAVTSFGDLTHGLPIEPTSLFIVHDTLSGNWFVFVSGGFSADSSTLGRVDFGPDLNNPAPNVANFGNYGGLLNGPKGIFIAEDTGHHWVGYLVNHNNSHLLRLDFSFNISTTPIITDLQDPKDGTAAATLFSPTDMAGIYDKGQWYLFITNEKGGTTPAASIINDSGSVVRIDLGTTLDTDYTVFTTGGIAATINNGSAGAGGTSFNYRLLTPSSISLSKDCGDIYAYITDSSTSQLVTIQMPVATGPYNAIDYNDVGGLNHPSCISSVLRDQDYLYAFITNAYDSSLSMIDFNACHNSSIPSYTEVNPPKYTYDSPGVYNIYYVINQGLPTMQTDCRTITVLPAPTLFINSGITLCQGDTTRLYAISSSADSIRWTSAYAIDTFNLYTDSVRVYPQYSTSYGVTLYYPDGCIVDTSVSVNVINIAADAGPDRSIIDGASTVLGGPNTTNNGNEIYIWTPNQYISDTALPNPVANPPYSFTYYLTVAEISNNTVCFAEDTVVVNVSCGDITLPNAFAPNSESPQTNTFGILNNEIVALNYFRIYNRWGEEVFSATQVSQRWDGTFNGKPAPTDVYVWEADGFCSSGLKVTKKGNVTLLR